MATIASEPAEATATLPLDEFWLKDPLDPARNLLVEVVPPFETDEEEDQESFHPLGREDAVVVADVIRSATGILNLEFWTSADYQAFRRLRSGQRTLLLQTPFDEWWYVRLGPNAPASLESAADGTRYRVVEVEWTSQGRP